MLWLIEKSHKLLKNTQSSHITFILSRPHKIAAYGINQPFKTDPICKLRPYLGYRYSAIHSEWAALKRLSIPLKRLSENIGEFTIVNVRIKSDGSVGLSKPCQICQRLLAFFGVKEIYFTNGNGIFECLQL